MDISTIFILILLFLFMSCLTSTGNFLAGLLNLSATAKNVGDCSACKKKDDSQFSCPYYG